MDFSTILKVFAEMGPQIETLVVDIGVGNLIAMIPSIIEIIRTITDEAHDAQQRGLGESEAYAVSAKLCLEMLQKAKAAAQDAAKGATDHPDDDGGFDPDGRRH